MTASTTTSRTVLIASSASGVRQRFADALRDAGHRALEAERAADLLAAVAPDQPAVDLLLLDLGLPGGAGVPLVQQVRDRAGNLRVVVFSGSITRADEVRGLAALRVTGYVNEHSDARQILPALAPHLFPDSFNRRSSPRVVLAIPVSYRFDRTIAGALTLNIGKGGLAVRSMSPLAVATAVRARFRLPGSGHEIGADSRVVWSDRRVGMGLQFERVEAEDQNAIDEYVDRHHPGETGATQPR